MTHILSASQKPPGAPGGPGGGPGGPAAAPGALGSSGWFISNFKKNLDFLKIVKLKSYSPGTHSNRSGTVDLYRKIFAPGL